MLRFIRLFCVLPHTYHLLTSVGVWILICLAKEYLTKETFPQFHNCQNVCSWTRHGMDVKITNIKICFLTKIAHKWLSSVMGLFMFCALCRIVLFLYAKIARNTVVQLSFGLIPKLCSFVTKDILTAFSHRWF